ncbi:hypothetical protein U1Q18_039626 [Sarracenia purpurea var. burkii]
MGISVVRRTESPKAMASSHGPTKLLHRRVSVRRNTCVKMPVCKCAVVCVLVSGERRESEERKGEDSKRRESRDRRVEKRELTWTGLDSLESLVRDSSINTLVFNFFLSSFAGSRLVFLLESLVLDLSSFWNHWFWTCLLALEKLVFLDLSSSPKAPT